MRRVILAFMLMSSVILLTSCAKQAAKGTSFAKPAESVVDSMAKGDFASATANFNAIMKAQMPADKLGQVWSQLTAQVGPFKARTGTREAKEQGYNSVYVTCQFEKTNIDIKVVFDDKNQVTGLFMVPTQSTSGGK